MERSVKILFLAANPGGTSPLGLDKEIRSIDLALRQAEFREKFEILQHWAVRAADLQGYLLRHKPDIVHFSGHGSTANEILLEDKNGYSQPVSEDAISQLFFLLRENIRCVVLNACYSEIQAKAVARHIDCVIGMSRSFGDLAAISFAGAFYQALGFGKNVRNAFDLACLQINLDNLGEQDTPQLIAINKKPEKIVFVERSDSQPETHPTTGRNVQSSPQPASSALAIWQEKLRFLLEQEAILTDPSQKFTLRKQIEEAQVKIKELSG